ncbi:MAG: hypothetical protein AAB335_04265, partial [candidate division NC10 bacterium]
YFEFVVREFVPGITRLGSQPSEAWYTVYGNFPQILTAGGADTGEAIYTALGSEDWQALEAKLESYVDNLEKKVIRATGGFQL